MKYLLLLQPIIWRHGGGNHHGRSDGHSVPIDNIIPYIIILVAIIAVIYTAKKIKK